MGKTDNQKNFRIVVLDGVCANPGDLSWDAFGELGCLEVYDRTDKANIVARAKDADAIIINKVTVTAGLLDQLPRLKYIGELATGYNNIDLDATRERGIVVTNIPAYSTDSVAQMVFAHLLNVADQVAYYADENRRGRWSKCPDFCYWDSPLMEISGKTMGIIGLGNIGWRVAGIAHAFGMNVSAVTSKSPHELPSWIQKSTTEGLLATSDVVTLHCPLNDATRNLINSRTLELVRPGTVLINTGRGPLVDEEAVAEALQSGRLAAYCADVLTQEPPKADNPLLECKNAFITPHIAWASLEARRRLLDTACQNLKAFIEGTPQNAVC